MRKPYLSTARITHALNKNSHLNNQKTFKKENCRYDKAHDSSRVTCQVKFRKQKTNKNNNMQKKQKQNRPWWSLPQGMPYLVYPVIGIVCLT